MKIPENIQEIIQYILQFLLRTENNEVIKHIGYTSDEKEFEKYKLIIKPSRFFDEDFYGTKESLPTLPLKSLKSSSGDIRIIYGSPKIEKINNTVILHADLIASTYFLISRYEEMIRPEVRDEHGRFIGKESIAYKAGFLHRPIVEEYGKILREYVREIGVKIDEPQQEIEKIYLTTDVDKLAHFRNIKSTVKAIFKILFRPKNTITALKTYFGNINSDPWYTFPLLFDFAKNLQRSLPNTEVKSIAFIKVGGKSLPQDKPLQNIESKDFQTFFELCKKENVEIGLHPSYQAGIEPNIIFEEKALLEKVIGKKTVLSRNHYLCSREPEDFQTLINAGFTDDFTMGFADVAGFRLGTCRAVKWIDPKQQKRTSLLLHPLTIMDNTLNDKRYMRLKVDEAFSYCNNLVDEVKKHNGELVLLWHNISMEENNKLYHRDLYEWMINYLRK
ncbi:conserved hypothetical protein [uncultured Paludibacter sp.]|uniref:DUF7033 domain-containing protein n=1 Tax=uncultured Paludibacter sp. TaxID=497635 RepID=A0A653A4Y7_9BACT|nr:conserved hypothetical protein [uncultured Paludibacter sp.]